MIFIKERVIKICDELFVQQTTPLQQVEEWEMAPGHFLTVLDSQSNGNFSPFNTQNDWGGRDYNCWFKTRLAISKMHKDKCLALKVETNLEGWDAINPQFIVYIGERMTQGLDINHREVLLTNISSGEEIFDIHLHAYTSMSDLISRFNCRLMVALHQVHQDVRGLYFDLMSIVDSLDSLEETDILRVKGLNILNETINLLDLRQPHSEQYHLSVQIARQYIKDEFYENAYFHHKDGVTLTAIGHTHIDIAWHWSVDQTRQKVARSFATVLDLMDQYPDFRFMSSQAQLYEFIKHDHPDLYKRIKTQVKAGRFEVEGAMWVEPDCNVISGESLVRQLLFGKTFFKDEFGVDCKILWLPDVFGYSAALPQILRKANVDYFMTTKINWNQFNQLPYDTFNWKGIDGSEVLTHMITTTDPVQSFDRFYTTYNGIMHPGSVKGAWNRYQQKVLSDDVLMAFGYGDGGGGVTFEMLETAKRLKNGYSSIPKVNIDSAKSFFERLEKNVQNNKRLPTWTGELYMEGHRGTYTSMARNKRDNRRSELNYQEIEKIGSITEQFGMDYQQELINRNWKTILLNQFHDILPGTSIKEVYDVTDHEYSLLLKDAKRLKHEHLYNLSNMINTTEISLLVFNSLGEVSSQYVTFEYDCDIAFHLISDNQSYPVQKVSHNTYVFYAQNLPSIGYKVFTIQAGEYMTDNHLIVTPTCLANKYFDIKLNESGEFISFFDKRAERELIPVNEVSNRLVAYEDKPMDYDNWDIDIYYDEKKWVIDNVECIKVTEEGPLRGALAITRKFLDSTIRQTIKIYKDRDCVDVSYVIDWKQSQILLKTLLPVDVNSTKATYDIQFGHVERPTYQNTSWDMARFEVCAHQWVDLGEGDFGMSILNDSKYGHDIKDKMMRITLLKSGIHPFEQADQELHSFTYSIYPHQGNFKVAKTQVYARELNTPATAIILDINLCEDKLNNQLSFYQIDSPNIVIDTIKKAEDKEGYIVRLYESHNKTTTSVFSCYNEIISCFECDLMENILDNLVTCSNHVDLKFKPFEIKTIRINFK